VGGSKQQKGHYKDKSKDGKEHIATIRTKHLMWIVRYTWEKSFTRIEMNKDAIAERGLGSLNYILLDHTELQAIQDRLNMVNLHDDGDRYYPQDSLHNLNTKEGVAGEAFDLFLEER
jgi:hypothetical protein